MRNLPKMQSIKVACMAVLVLTIAACASKPPPRVAADKAVVINGKEVIFGGQFADDDNELELYANSDPIMRGSFLPLTPALKITSEYEGANIISQCTFSSRMKVGGAAGKLLGAIKSSRGKTADKCVISVDGKEATTLFF